MHLIYRNIIKRILDIIAALLLLALFWWLLLAIGALVQINLGSPILFKQSRPGKGGAVFKLCKFRTMTDARDSEGNLLPDEERLTPFGKWLRSTSLDELPELFNILKGDMSFVGPRPLLVEYLPLYSATQARRHEVRPGLTGLAQCRGRNLLSWNERFDLDIEYVNSYSFGLDMRIIAETIGVVLQRKGVSSSTSLTMEPFKGAKIQERRDEK